MVTRKPPSLSEAYSFTFLLSSVLKIRVSVVQTRPRAPLSKASVHAGAFLLARWSNKTVDGVPSSR